MELPVVLPLAEAGLPRRRPAAAVSVELQKKPAQSAKGASHWPEMLRTMVDEEIQVWLRKLRRGGRDCDELLR